MDYRIETIASKKLLGKRLQMSLTNNKTTELWHSFMIQKNEIQHAVGINLYSLQTYPSSYFCNFNLNTEFEKWAAIEVVDFNFIPNKMEAFTLKAGMYVAFPYKGSSSNAASVFQYIWEIWLPNSIYTLDNRPHFEILGDKYKNNDPNSEEEIWIPIKLKNNEY